MGRRRKQKPSFDKGLIGLTVGLTLLGVIAVADASAPQAQTFFNDSFYFAKQQLIWGGVGLFLMLVATLIHYSTWKQFSTLFLGISLVSLVAVLLPNLGTRALGARRWLNLGPVGFQPAEIVKLSLAFYFASLAEAEKPLLAYLIPLAVIGGLIMFQPDLGTTIIVFIIGFVQMFVAGVNLFYLVGAGLLGIVASAILILTSGYRRARLMTFFQNSIDPLGSSYHIRQVLIALGSGGILGVGLGASRQKYLFLPEAATDSVFAVVAEEVGFVGATVLIILLVFFIIRLIKIALAAPDTFSRVFVAGVVAWIGGQIFLNIGSMVALVPLTGIPLPFFSYGGSSLTAILFAMGVVINISRHR